MKALDLDGRLIPEEEPTEGWPLLGIGDVFTIGDSPIEHTATVDKPVSDSKLEMGKTEIPKEYRWVRIVVKDGEVIFNDNNIQENR